MFHIPLDIPTHQKTRKDDVRSMFGPLTEANAQIVDCSYECAITTSDVDVSTLLLTPVCTKNS